MVVKEMLEEIAQEVGANIEPEKKMGRPKGETVGAPNVKTMTKKALISEVGTSRKKIKKLEAEKAELIKDESQDEIMGPGIPSAMYAVVPVMVYDAMAERFGPHWKLQEHEAVSIGAALEKVVDRYFGVISGGAPELAALVLAVSIATIPRAMQSVAVAKAKNVTDTGKKQEPKPKQEKGKKEKK